MNIIHELEHLGYKFGVKGEKITYETDTYPTNPERANELLAELRNHKAQALAYLRTHGATNTPVPIAHDLPRTSSMASGREAEAETTFATTSEIVPIAAWPEYKARHRLTVVASEWSNGSKTPTIYCESSESRGLPVLPADLGVPFPKQPSATDSQPSKVTTRGSPLPAFVVI